MTLKELAALDVEMLTPAQVAAITGHNPQTIRVAARTRPESLPFPTLVMGNLVRIPKEAFLRWMRGDLPRS